MTVRPGWSGPGGAAEVLRVSYPLILGHVSFTLQMFIDRLFLTWYAPEAVAGAITAGFVVWTPMILFIGTGEYVTTFVAQYIGAGRRERVGAVMGQGVYFALLAGALMASLAPLAPAAFARAGHASEVLRHEVAYASALLLGAAPTILLATLSGFFAGRGHTRVVLRVNVLATVLNIGLDWLWIFGRLGFPEGGAAGAAWATVASQAFGSAVLLAVMLSRENRREFGTGAVWRLEGALLRRLLRYGLPAGLAFCLEVFAFALFLLIVGRLGTEPLAATGLAFNLNMIVFTPMLGMGLGIASLVGRYLGEDRPEVAERVTWSAFAVSLVYMTACGLLYAGAPRLLTAPLVHGGDVARLASLEETIVVLLRFVAVYSIFDMANVVFSAALKGAGDTRFPVLSTVAFSWLVMLAPAYVACEHLGGGLYTAWVAASAYVFCQGLAMLTRFRAGHWKSMRVIEPEVAATRSDALD